MADEATEVPPANPNKITTEMSKEGMLCAQAALLIMAMIPIYKTFKNLPGISITEFFHKFSNVFSI